MDWQVLQDGLKALVAAAGGIEAHNIAWDGEPDAMRGYPMAVLELTRHGRDRVADEVRYEPDSDGRLVPYLVGQRAVTLQVTVKSRNQRGLHKATAILERLRTRLELPRSQQMLDDLEVVLRESSTPTVDQSAVSQQREESIAQLTLTLGYVAEERDEEHPEEAIEHVQVGGEITTGPDEGATITVPEQTIP